MKQNSYHTASVPGFLLYMAVIHPFQPEEALTLGRRAYPSLFLEG